MADGCVLVCDELAVALAGTDVFGVNETDAWCCYCLCGLSTGRGWGGVQIKHSSDKEVTSESMKLVFCSRSCAQDYAEDWYFTDDLEGR